LIILTNGQILSKKNLTQDNQQVSKKKCHQEKDDFFMAGVCQKAYGNKAFKNESTCRPIKCNACMLIVTAEQVELKKVGGRSLLAPPVRICSKRAHKNKMTSPDTVVKRYLKDGNGCSHDDTSQWNEERSIYYWEENRGRGTMSITRWVLNWNTIALHARKMSGRCSFD